MNMRFQVRLDVINSLKEKTPKALVNASRPADAPLHDEFEWDDSIAGELHREEQARNIIRSIRVESVDTKPRMFHAVIIDGKREYATIDEIRVDEMLSQQVVDRLLGHVEAALRDLEYLQKPDLNLARPHLEAALHVLQQ